MAGAKEGGFAAMVKHDLTMAYRNGLVLAAAVLSAVLIVVVDFAVPETAKLTAREYIADLTADGFVARYLAGAGESETVLGSEAELVEAVGKDAAAMGIVVKGTLESPSVVVYRQGSEPESAVKSVVAATSALLQAASGSPLEPRHRVELIREESVKPPFNRSMVPVIMATEVSMLGFLFIAVMVFQEKAEGSVAAYRVSPGGTWRYVASKVTSNTLLALAYGATILLFTVGPGRSLLPALGLVGLAAVLLSALGLAVSVFFQDLSGFLYPAMMLFILFGTPVTAYFVPSLRLHGMELIPSYPLAFGIREALFPTGKAGFYLPMALILAAEAGAMLLASVWAAHRKLMREAQ